jgi:hypothetical protein
MQVDGSPEHLREFATFLREEKPVWGLATPGLSEHEPPPTGGRKRRPSQTAAQVLASLSVASRRRRRSEGTLQETCAAATATTAADPPRAGNWAGGGGGGGENRDDGDTAHGPASPRDAVASSEDGTAAVASAAAAVAAAAAAAQDEPSVHVTLWPLGLGELVGRLGGLRAGAPRARGVMGRGGPPPSHALFRSAAARAERMCAHDQPRVIAALVEDGGGGACGIGMGGEEGRHPDAAVPPLSIESLPALDLIVVNHALYGCGRPDEAGEQRASSGGGGGGGVGEHPRAPPPPPASSSSSPLLDDVLALLLSLLVPGGTLLVLHRQGRPVSLARGYLDVALRGEEDWTACRSGARSVDSDDVGAALARLGTPHRTLHTLQAHADVTALCVRASELAGAAAGAAARGESRGAEDPRPTPSPSPHRPPTIAPLGTTDAALLSYLTGVDARGGETLLARPALLLRLLLAVDILALPRRGGGGDAGEATGGCVLAVPDDVLVAVAE